MIGIRFSPAEVSAFISTQSSFGFSYATPGMTAESAPHGYTVDHNRILLGHGRAAFDEACAALTAWRMFALDWVELFPATVTIEPGATVAIKAKVLGFQFLNACKVVYTISPWDPTRLAWPPSPSSGSKSGVDDARPPRLRFGFAYGTLPDHAEIGEERFMIQWDAEDDSVSYDLLAFSRPNPPLARIFYPYTRSLQKRFARDSLASMAAAVRKNNPRRDR